MIGASEYVTQQLSNGDVLVHDFYLLFTDRGLASELMIGPENIWADGVEIDDSVSSDSEFQFGTTIINKCTITINNNNGTYDNFEFEGKFVNISANVVIPDYYGVPSGYDISKGRYIVNEAVYTDNLITLECYDRMFLFDKPYDNSTCQYPATLEEIVQSACDDISNEYFNGTYNIYGSFQSDLKDITINRKPKAGVTYREIISWAAQITGCFARFNNNGELELKWFPSSTNGSVTSIYNKSLSRNVYTITGVRATYKLYAENEEVLYGNETTVEPVIEVIPDSALETLEEKEIETAYNEVFAGTEGYVVELKDNEFLSSENVHAIVYYLYNKIHGFTVRRATVNNVGNILIEAGDYINVQDTKHNTTIAIHVTGVRYTSGGSQTLTSAGESASVSATVGNSVETRNYMNMANRATQIEYNIAREFDKETTYHNGDYATYNNLFYKYIGDEEEEIEDDWADWEHEVGTGENGDDPSINEPIIFNSVSPTQTRGGGSSNLLGDGLDLEPEITTDPSEDETSGEDRNGFDKSKWQRVVLTDELFFQLARRIARPYDTETSYDKGDYVYYNKNFYVCLQDISQSGDFDDTKWRKIILSDYFGTKRSGKGDWWIGSETEYLNVSTYDEDVVYFVYADNE